MPQGLPGDDCDIDVDNFAKRARIEACSSLLNPTPEAATSGNGEINRTCISHQFGDPSLAPAQAKGPDSQHQNLEDINQGKDEGLQGSDSLIHTKMFPGEASLIHPSLLGI